MISLVLISILLLTTLTLPLISQPLRVGLTLLLSTLIACVTAGYVSSSWYAYIIFIVFIGGLLVIFAYVAALAPNSFFIPLNIKIPFIVLTTLYVFTLFTIISPYSPTQPDLLSSTLLSNSGSLLYSPGYFFTLILLTYILLLTLVRVVKICSF